MRIEDKSRRISTAILMALIVSIAISAFGINRIRFGGELYHRNQQVDEFIADILPPPEYIVEPYLVTTLMVHSPAQRDDYRQRLRAMQELYEERADYWQQSDFDSELKLHLRDRSGAEARRFWQELNMRLLPAMDQRDDAAMRASYRRIQRIYEAHRSHIDQEVALALRKKSEIRSAADGTLAVTLAIIAALALMLVAAVLAHTRYFARQVLRPLNDTATTMAAMAQGDLDAGRIDAHREDEIGAMTRAIEVFRANAIERQRLQTEADRNAQAELERQADIKQQRVAEMQDIAGRFEATVGDVVGGVAAASSQLQSTALAMSAAAEQSSRQTSEASATLNEASAGVIAAAAASDEFALSIGEISKQAANSAQMARVAASAAKEADTTMAELQAAADQVGQIVELIADIAQRTNLLALNASIEAARSAESGLGFAVVAAEVKHLAAQTSRATDDVSHQIKAIQDATGAGVSALKAIGEKVDALEATSIAIAAAVDQQSMSGQELARSVDLAARSTDSVASNIVDVRETSLATGSAASQVLTSSSQLEDQAAALRVQVQQFLNHVRAA